MSEHSKTPDALEEELALLAQLIGAGDAAPARAGIPRRAAGQRALPSFTQEVLWLLHRATPGLVAYNMPTARRLRGTLDIPALERALSTIVARHEAFRTRFVEVASEVTLAIDPPAPVPVRLVDVTSLPAESREMEVQRLLTERARTPFEFADEHMFRVTLIRVSADDHVLVLETHHIVADGWSLGLVERELAEAYRAYRSGETPNLPVVGTSFSDFALWQHDQLSGDRLATLLEFWRAHLGDADTPLELQTDRPRPPAPMFDGARATTLLPTDRLDAIRRLGQQHGATLYMVLLSAFATVLHRYTGKGDVLVGSGTAGRTHPDTEAIVGYLSNTVVQRVSFRDDPSLSELLARVRDSAAAGFDHQDIPLEKLMLELRRDQGRASAAPLFDVVLTMQDTPGRGLSLEGLTVEPIRMEGRSTKFDITLLPTERSDGLALSLQYRTDLYDPETMARLLTHLVSVLDAAVADPSCRVSRLRLLSDAERAQLDAWNATECEEGAAASIPELFAARAARTPDQLAVVSGTHALTYSQLLSRARDVSAALRAAGVAPGDRVGMLMDRSADGIVAILGILWTGAAYVSIPPVIPPARRDRQLEECGAQVVLASGDVPPLRAGITLLDIGATGESGADEPIRATPHAVAYVLFTSGSTGTPKGVAVTHGNVVHYVRAISRVLADVPAAEAGDGLAALAGLRIGSASTFSADLGNTSVFTALLAGATLHVLPPEATTDPERFVEVLRAQPLDVLKITPGHFSALRGDRSGEALREVLPQRWILFGGESLDPQLADDVLSAGCCRLLNHYGPTETTIGACTFEATRSVLDALARRGARTVPIGRPLVNTRAVVLDANGVECPVGIPGELWIAGAGVTQGYIGRPELTAERFATIGGAGAYRTGDRVRRLVTGDLEYLGRLDRQVKIRGYRVELGEIEHVLRAHAALADAAVTRWVAATGDDRIAAYVVPRTAEQAGAHAPGLTAEDVCAYLAEMLPQYMIPSTIVLLDVLPRSANGKIDYARLPQPGVAPAAPAMVTEAQTDTERELITIWRDVLKVDRVDTTDSFLALGGHSLMAIRALGRISRAFGVRLPLRTLFDAPTVAELARVVDAERTSAVAQPAAITPRSRDAYRLKDLSAPGTPVRGES